MSEKYDYEAVKKAIKETPIVFEKEYIYYVESESSKESWLEDDFEKELYKEYYKQLRSGDTNMGYDQWKLTSEILNKKEPHVLCERCQKDITNLIYNRGDHVIIDLSRYEIQRGNEYIIAPYCKECIEIIKKEMIKNDD